MIKQVILFITLSFLSVTTFSQSRIDAITLSKKLPVLNGRAYFTFPAMATNTERVTDIMSAGPNANEETRIVYDTGKMRLVFFAQELYMIGDKNLLDEVNKDSSYILNFTSRVLIATDSLYAILSTPLKTDSIHSGILNSSLLVQTADGTLFRIDAYINPAAYAERSSFRLLAEKVFKTLANGLRKNVRNRRIESCAMPDSSKVLQLLVPTNYCITIDKGYDFEVFKFHKYRSFTDSTWTSMLIYVGDHPSYFYRNYGMNEQDAKKDSGMFLGKPVQWLVFKDPMHSLFLKEQIIPQSSGIPSAVIHVVMMANRAGVLPELTHITEAIELRSK